MAIDVLKWLGPPLEEDEDDVDLLRKKFLRVETTVVADGPQSISKDDRLASVLADERRSVDRKRDKYRHPVETLDFFQITSDQTVIEYAPGGGWYTRILAPYLSCDGQYIAVSFSPDDVATLNADFRERLHEGGRTFSATQSRALGIPEERLPFHFGDAVPDELDGTVDRVESEDRRGRSERLLDAHRRSRRWVHPPKESKVSMRSSVPAGTVRSSFSSVVET